MNLTQFRKLIREEISKVLSEVSIPANVAQFSKKKGATAIVKKVAGWAEKAGKKIVNGRAIGKNYDTLILDLTTDGSEIYINLEDNVIKLFGKKVTDPTTFANVLKTKVSSQTESVHSLQEKTQEEINAEKAEINAAMKSAVAQKKALDSKMKVLRDRLTSINSQKAEKPTTSPAV